MRQGKRTRVGPRNHRSRTAPKVSLRTRKLLRCRGGLNWKVPMKLLGAMKRWGYPVPLSNKELKGILANREERKELHKVIRKALA